MMNIKRVVMIYDFGFLEDVENRLLRLPICDVIVCASTDILETPYPPQSKKKKDDDDSSIDKSSLLFILLQQKSYKL